MKLALRPEIINLLRWSGNDIVNFRLPACSSVQFDCAMVTALPCLVITVTATDM